MVVQLTCNEQVVRSNRTGSSKKQSKNASKHDKCNITLDSLKEKIKEWNSKYGVYPNNINYVKFELLGIKFNR